MMINGDDDFQDQRETSTGLYNNRNCKKNKFEKGLDSQDPCRQLAT
jgi:hypothetical protein